MKLKREILVQSKIIVHECADGKDVGGVDSNAHNLDANLVVLVDDHFIVFCLVARWIGVRIKLHVGGDRVAGDEARQRSDFGEDAHLVDLRHDSIENFALKRAENDGTILDRVGYEASARLNDPVADAVDVGDGNHETILARARALHLLEQLFLDGIQEIWTEVTRMQVDLVLKLNMVEHLLDFCRWKMTKVRESRKPSL